MGIIPVVSMQGFSAAKERWGDNGAATIWNNCLAKLTLPALSEDDTLKMLSTIIGTRDRTVTSTTVRQTAWATTGSQTESERREPTMRPEDITRMAPFTALLMFANLPPIRLRLVTYWDETWLRQRASAEDLYGGAPSALDSAAVQPRPGLAAAFTAGRDRHRTATVPTAKPSPRWLQI
jgi:type IV secretion system protein VirD4